MKSLHVMALVGLGLVATGASAATFEIWNHEDTDVWASVYSDGLCKGYDKIKPKEIKKYDSGVFKIYGVHLAYKQKNPMLEAQGRMDIKVYRLDTQIDGVWLNNKIELSNEAETSRTGSYLYRYNSDQNKTGTAKGTPINYL